MKVAFHDIIEPHLQVPVTDDGWFPHDEIELVSTVTGALSISRRTTEEAHVAGSLAAQVALACDRCCRSAPVDLEVSFDYDCVIGKEDPSLGTDTECREEDCYKLYLHEPVIDLGDILREQVYLALPVSVLCRQSCKGICPGCGTDLNAAECSCSPDESTSPFAVLRQLKGD